MSHLTDSDRLEIEHGRRQRMSFLQIARELGKSHTTISREVLKRRTDSDKGAPGRITNRCVFRRSCNIYDLCPGRKCRRKCSACKTYNEVCPKLKEDVCSRPPSVYELFSLGHRGRRTTGVFSVLNGFIKALKNTNYARSQVDMETVFDELNLPFNITYEEQLLPIKSQRITSPGGIPDHAKTDLSSNRKIH